LRSDFYRPVSGILDLLVWPFIFPTIIDKSSQVGVEIKSCNGWVGADKLVADKVYVNCEHSTANGYISGLPPINGLKINVFINATPL